MGLKYNSVVAQLSSLVKDLLQICTLQIPIALSYKLLYFETKAVIQKLNGMMAQECKLSWDETDQL